MGKTVGAIVGVVAAVAIAVVAPYLAPLALGALGITATATALAVATAVIGIGLSVAVMVGMRALGVGTVATPKTPVGPPSVFRQSISDSIIVYGKRRVGGLLVFFHSRVDSNGVHWRYFVIAVAGHHTNDAVEWMLNDEVVTIGGSGLVTSGKYANNAWLDYEHGSSAAAANAIFVAECDGLWTTAHQGKGISKIYARFRLTDEVVEAGMPNITAIIEGKDDILDPRTGTTGYTRNAALIFYDWMQLPREEGGFGAYDDEIPDDTFISAQANVCDETVEAEPRYAFDAVIVTGATPSEVRDVMVVNCAGSYTYSGGKHLMRPGYWVPVSETLSEDDLSGPIQVSPFMASDRAANQVSGTYVNPDDGYQGAPFATQLITPAPEDIRQLDLDLAFTTSKYQAERVASIMLQRAQHEKTVMWPMNIVGLKAKALDTVQLDSARYGLSNYAWMVGGWSLSADYNVILSLREESEDIYTEPTPVTPVTAPVIVSPDPMLTQAEIIALIDASWVTGLTFSITDAGAVTISNHTRWYSDKSVAVTGTGGTPHAAGGSPGDLVYIYYDDPPRAGGAVTYQHIVLSGGIGDASAAFVSSAHPYRHFLVSATVPLTGDPPASGGSDVGSGGGTVTPTCPAEGTPILLANETRDGPGEEAPAGIGLEGKWFWTQQELTREWGAFKCIAARIVSDQALWRVERDGRVLKASGDHPLDVNGEWQLQRDLGTPDGRGDVVLLTVEDAHTFVAAGMLSHNKVDQGSI